MERVRLCLAGGEGTSDVDRAGQLDMGVEKSKGEGMQREEDTRKVLTLNVTSRLSPSSNTVDLTCLPSSINVMPTYNETLSINLKTPSARMTVY